MSDIARELRSFCHPLRDDGVDCALQTVRRGIVVLLEKEGGVRQ